MNSARLLSPILFVAAAGCLAKDAPLCRIEETVWDSGKGGWHTYAALEVRPDKSCIWTVDPPATWSDLFRTGSFQLEGAEYQELLLVLESDAFSKSGAVPTHRVFIDDHRARVPSAVAAVLDRFRKANWTSVVHWFPSPEIPVDLFKRDQPLIGDLILWGGGIIVRADRFYSLDLDRATTTALVIPGMESIGALAMRGASEEVALGRDGGGGA
ncbi:MAG: hypothetical protein HY293_15745, partial [Planctomycetes bacterium]|nr:hypothetical protein [Planctomycetota bacterium]